MDADHPATTRRPPTAPRTVLGDVRVFLLRRPARPTRVGLPTREAREEYTRRILQRLDVDVAGYEVLNIHQIGIEAPARYVFEELLSWDGDSSCWPNHIATVDRIDGQLEQIRIHPLGFRRIHPLFNLNALRIRHVPGDSDVDNARYLLYRCSGGYPIGIFVLFVRSPIAEQGETEAAQVFLGVGFDFYGKKHARIFRPLNRLWERLHDRVTSNVLHRFKQLCEWRFERTRSGL